MTLMMRITNETAAAHSNCIWLSNIGIIKDIGLVLVVFKNETADIVIMEFTK